MGISVNSNSSQFHAGPGGALTAAALVEIEVYSKLSQTNAEYAVEDMVIAGSMAQAAAIANKEAGIDQADATRTQMIQSSVSAGLTGASALATYAAARGPNSEINNTQKELEGCDKLNANLQDKMLEDTKFQLAQQNDPNLPQQPNPNLPPRSPENALRITELKSGKYLTSKEASPDSIEVRNAKAVKALTPTETSDLRESLEKEISNKYDAISSKSSSISQRNTYINLVEQIANHTAGAICQSFQAKAQEQQGIEQGNAALASTASSVANGGVENQRSQNANFFSMVANVLQALKAAASAYAA